MKTYIHTRSIVICMGMAIFILCGGIGQVYAQSIKYPYPYKPRTRQELRGIIRQEIKNQGDEVNLNMIDISQITDMTSLFSEESFNGDISEWDVSNVTDMSSMFRDAKAFNGDISKWDMSNVDDMAWMFWGAESFNGDISKWDVSKVRSMKEMFRDAKAFNGDISGWDVSGVKNMYRIFYGAESFNGDISKWNISTVWDMSGMFHGAESFNGDISGWDVSHVWGMKEIFYGAKSFNRDISGWDVSHVKNMGGMFYGAELFNGDISEWDVSNVTDMSGMFYGAKSFDRDLSAWQIHPELRNGALVYPHDPAYIRGMHHIFEGSKVEGREPKWYVAWETENKPKAVEIARKGAEAYKAGRLREAKKHYEQAIGYYADDEYLFALGDILFDIMDSIRTKELYELAIQYGYKKPYFAYYNIACMYSRDAREYEEEGKKVDWTKKRGLEYLEKALQAGYTYWTHMEKDEDIAFLRKQPEYKALIAKYLVVGIDKQ